MTRIEDGFWRNRRVKNTHASQNDPPCPGDAPLGARRESMSDTRNKIDRIVLPVGKFKSFCLVGVTNFTIAVGQVDSTEHDVTNSLG